MSAGSGKSGRKKRRTSIGMEMSLLTIGMIIFYSMVMYTITYVEMEAFETRMIDRSFKHLDADEDGVIDEASDRYLKELSMILKVSQNKTNRWHLTAVILALIISIIVIHFMIKKLINPIHVLLEEMDRVGKGNLDERIELDTNNEISDLADGFNSMMDQLKKYMEDLSQTTREKEDMSSQISLVRRISQNLIPDRYPSRNDSQLYAEIWNLSPEGGACYYDFFMADEDNMVLILGNSADSGVMAVLFALISQTYLQSYGKMGYSPARMLAETNNRLSVKNELGLNVAATVCVIDLARSKMKVSSAGGEAFVFKSAGREAAVEEDEEVTIPIGNMENVPYKNRTIKLSQGDLFLFYTNGLVNAVNSRGERYGSRRVKEMLVSSLESRYELKDITDYVKADLESFTGGHNQDEDCAIMGFRYMA